MTSPANQPASEDSALLRFFAPREPSRMRIAILWIALIIWIVTLIVLYYTTVLPRRPSPPERGLAAIPQANTDAAAAR